MISLRSSSLLDDPSRMKMLALTLLVLTVPLVPSTRPGPQGIGRLPALGFNSWNAYRCDINEKQFLDAAQLMIDLGLKDAGYEYVNIDDCWSWGERDPKTKRLRHDPFRFPEGINATAKKIHDLGLKIGIYSSAGTNTCAGYPASLGFEDIDAQTWADWGIDYLKYDNCNIPKEWQDDCAFCVVDLDNHADFPPGPNGTCPEEADNWCPKGYDYRKSKTFERYRRMKEAIDKTGRPMLYSLCQWGSANVQAWGAEVSQSWRSTGDIFRESGLFIRAESFPDILP
jgi:alpha-galactosidase